MKHIYKHTLVVNNSQICFDQRAACHNLKNHMLNCKANNWRALCSSLILEFQGQHASLKPMIKEPHAPPHSRFQHMLLIHADQNITPRCSYVIKCPLNPIFENPYPLGLEALSQLLTSKPKHGMQIVVPLFDNHEVLGNFIIGYSINTFIPCKRSNLTRMGSKNRCPYVIIMGHEDFSLRNCVRSWGMIQIFGVAWLQNSLLVAIPTR